MWSQAVIEGKTLTVKHRLTSVLNAESPLKEIIKSLFLETIPALIPGDLFSGYSRTLLSRMNWLGKKLWVTLFELCRMFAGDSDQLL